MSVPKPEKRIAAFERLGFGMFVHWGLYSQLGAGEWVMERHKINKDEYRKLADTFTAKDFDARKLAALAKRAGMKYITLTTRHHEGFSLYDTKGLSNYDAPHSAAGRDLVKEFTEACRAEGILPFFYHTTLDWFQESFEKDFDGYLEYLRRSVEILCTQYGPIGGFWFDGNWSKPEADWQEDALYAVIRRHQPEALIINNTGLGQGGRLGNPELDSVTYEQSLPTALNREGAPKYVAAEMCQTINVHWGIGQRDFNCKSAGQLIEALCAARKAGANYLLNIGPTAQGGVQKLQEALLETIGDWVNLCGESIYEGCPSQILAEGRDFVLDTKEKSYIFVHDLSIAGFENILLQNENRQGDRTLSNVKRKVKAIRWTDNDEPLRFQQDTDGKLVYNATGFPYGTHTVVRVAEVAYAE